MIAKKPVDEPLAGLVGVYRWVTNARGKQLKTEHLEFTFDPYNAVCELSSPVTTHEGHSFDKNMECKFCGVDWNWHQKHKKPCKVGPPHSRDGESAKEDE